MKFKFSFIVTVIVIISCKLINCVPIVGDLDDERDVKFLINKIKEAITKDSPQVSPSPHQEEKNPTEKVIKNSDEANVIRFDSKGGCKDKVKDVEKQHIESSTKHVEVEKSDSKNITEPQKENHHDKSSSVDDHAIRYDHHGNTIEEYKDSEEHHEDHNESSEEKPKKKKKKVQPNVAANDGDDNINLNSILNDEFINKQLENKKQHDDDDSEMDEDDDIPLITIPMYDILRQYQRMQQGFVSETEEYSDETTQDIFADPHLKNILKEISMERKAFKNENTDGKKVKPAAKRVFERHFGPSDESL